MIVNRPGPCYVEGSKTAQQVGARPGRERFRALRRLQREDLKEYRELLRAWRRPGRGYVNGGAK